MQLALDEFLQAGEWPQREQFRRKLTWRGLDDLDVEEMLSLMPSSSWESTLPPHDRIILSLQALQQLPEAQALLDVCMAMVQRAYELYRSDTKDADLSLRSDDPALLSAAGGDAGLLLRAIKVLDQHPPSMLGGWSGSGPESTPWSRWLHQTVMPAFRDVTTVEDYLAAQAKIIGASTAAPGPERIKPARQDKRTRAPAGPQLAGAAEMTSSANSKGIFLGHAHADRRLADLLRNTLVLAGVPHQQIFYSSSRVTGIPYGEEVRPYLLGALRKAGLVIELISESFLTRPMCLMELGGAWTLGTPIYPIVVPPLTGDMVAKQIGNILMGILASESEIDELFAELRDRLARDMDILTEARPWNSAIRDFKEALPEKLAAMAGTSSAVPSTSTSGKTVTSVQERLRKLEQ